MRIDQRNGGASRTVDGAYCTVDRYKAGNNTNTGTIQRITSTLAGFQNSIKYTAAGSGSFFQFGQQIEFFNCSDLQNQAVTISFRAKANNSNAGSTALIVRTRTTAGVDGAAIFAGTNVDTNITLTTSDASYTVTRTLPSSFGALSLEFALASHVSGDGFEITGVQLEPGTVATPFERRSYGQELSLCQRYYEVGVADSNGGYISAALVSIYGTISFMQTKRAAPTVSAPANWTTQAAGGGTTSRTFGTGSVSTTGFSAQLPGSDPRAQGSWIAAIEL
jgi:hypothetical protein